jgi:hypothetical protein
MPKSLKEGAQGTLVAQGNSEEGESVTRGVGCGCRSVGMTTWPCERRSGDLQKTARTTISAKATTGGRGSL